MEWSGGKDGVRGFQKGGSGREIMGDGIVHRIRILA